MKKVEMREKDPVSISPLLFPPSSVMQTEMEYLAFPISSNFALGALKAPRKYFPFRSV